MKAHTEYQTIDYHGKPAFVLVPWEEFKRVQPLLEGDKARATGIPQAVVAYLAFVWHVQYNCIQQPNNGGVYGKERYHQHEN